MITHLLKKLVPALLPLLALAGCDDPNERYERRRWEEPCRDESWLLATTSGSPSGAKCLNKNHRMRVQVASVASPEEAAALVFCECQRPDPSPAGSK